MKKPTFTKSKDPGFYIVNGKKIAGINRATEVFGAANRVYARKKAKMRK